MSMKKYLQQNRGLLVLGLFFCIFPGAMIALTEDVNFFQTNGFYCITVLVFVSIIYLLIDFMKKRAYDKRLANLLESEEISKDCQISDVSLRRVVNHCMRSEYSNIQNKDIHIWNQ